MRLLTVALLAAFFFPASAAAQDAQNPSLLIETREFPSGEFNRVGRDAPVMQLDEIHAVSWQVTIDNNLVYANPDGNAVLRVHDQAESAKYIEVGMGSPPGKKFWIAVQIPEDEGYVVVHSSTERGWHPEAKTIISYTDRAGMTVNNGERIVVSNLDVGQFAVGSYSIFGMESSTDPPAVNSGAMNVEFLSGDPGKNVLAFFPYFVTAAVGILVGTLFLTKRRERARVLGGVTPGKAGTPEVGVP